MSFLGLGSKKTEANGASLEGKSTITAQNGTSDEAKKLAAAALAAARDAASALNRGKIEVINNHMYYVCHHFYYYSIVEW